MQGLAHWGKGSQAPRGHMFFMLRWASWRSPDLTGATGEGTRDPGSPAFGNPQTSWERGDRRDDDS